MSSTNSTVITTTAEESDEFILPDEAQIILLILILSVALFGMLSNIINMTVFYKLRGDGSPINTILLGLAISDFAVCLTTFVLFVTTNYWLIEHLFTKYKIYPFEVFYVTVGIPHTIFARITVLLTALISLERCLCVAVPFKVKMIFTPERARISIALCFVTGGLVSIPIYCVNHLEWVHHPFLNMSVLRHLKTDEFYDMNYWFTPLEGVCLHIIPFLVVAVSTIVMIRKLKKRMAFRQSVTNQSSDIANKEKKIAVMVATVSTVFLIWNCPNIVLFLLTTFYPSVFSLERATDSDLVKIISYVTLLLNTTNSAINISIYLSNSSKYRQTFYTLFGLAKTKNRIAV